MFVKVFEIVSFPFGELDKEPNRQHRHPARAEEDDGSHLDHLVRKVGQLSDVDTERLIADAGQDFVQQRDVFAGERVRIRLDMRNDVEVLDVRNLLRQRGEFVEMGREQDRGPRDRRKVPAGVEFRSAHWSASQPHERENAYSEMAQANPKPS